MKLPRLKATNEELATLYCQANSISKDDICEYFGISKRTARNLVNICLQYAHEHDIPVYQTGRAKVIPIELLFEVYHWDIDSISRKVKRGRDLC